jgi:predicted transcriptional regulator of viral defense system
MKHHKKNKLDLLLKYPQNLFHTGDLSLLWNIENKNTLHTTIKRYADKGILIRIQKGFYSKIPLEQISPIKLGMSFLHSFCYLSTESILVKEGIISQAIPHITLISNQSKKFKIENNSYISRQMKDKFLFNEAGIVVRDSVKEASIERAIADMLYYDSNYHFDAPSLIDWDKVKTIQKEVGFQS